MKIRMEIEDKITENEIVIRCSELTEDVILLQKKLSEILSTKMQLHVMKQKTEYLLNLEEILFLESADNIVAVHTTKEIFETKQKLYELGEILPGSFMRVSKSTIINTGKIRAIHKNITGASAIEFANSQKIAYVSRAYIKALMEKLEEKRLKHE